MLGEPLPFNLLLNFFNFFKPNLTKPLSLSLLQQGKICLPKKSTAASCELQLLHSRSFLLEGHHLSNRQSSGAYPEHNEIQEAGRSRRAASAAVA